MGTPGPGLSPIQSHKRNQRIFKEGFAGSDPVNGFRGLAKISGFAGRVALAREARNVNRKQGLTPRSLC